jgi:hypothetical protein
LSFQEEIRASLIGKRATIVNIDNKTVAYDKSTRRPIFQPETPEESSEDGSSTGIMTPSGSDD